MSVPNSSLFRCDGRSPSQPITAAAPASEVQALIRSPTNMADAKTFDHVIKKTNVQSKLTIKHTAASRWENADDTIPLKSSPYVVGGGEWVLDHLANIWVCPPKGHRCSHFAHFTAVWQNR